MLAGQEDPWLEIGGSVVISEESFCSYILTVLDILNTILEEYKITRQEGNKG